MPSNESDHDNNNNRALSHKLRSACSQDRVLVRRIVRSYFPWHLNRTSALLRFVFALFLLYFICFSSIFPLFMFFKFFPVFALFSLFLFSQLYQQPIDPTYEMCYDPRVYDLSPAYWSYFKTRTWLHMQGSKDVIIFYHIHHIYPIY